MPEMTDPFRNWTVVALGSISLAGHSSDQAFSPRPGAIPRAIDGELVSTNIGAVGADLTHASRLVRP
jgi:hypothetical protein